MLTYGIIVFVRQSSTGIIVLIVYVDDIIILGNDSTGVADLKCYFGQQFTLRTWANFSTSLGLR